MLSRSRIQECPSSASESDSEGSGEQEENETAESTEDCERDSCNARREEEEEERIDRPAWMRYAPRTGWNSQSHIQPESSSGSAQNVESDPSKAPTTNTIKRSSNRFSPLFNSKREPFPRAAKASSTGSMSTRLHSDAKAGIRQVKTKIVSRPHSRRVHVGETVELLSMFKVDK